VGRGLAKLEVEKARSTGLNTRRHLAIRVAVARRFLLTFRSEAEVTPVSERIAVQKIRLSSAKLYKVVTSKGDSFC